MWFEISLFLYRKWFLRARGSRIIVLCCFNLLFRGSPSSPCMSFLTTFAAAKFSKRASTQWCESWFFRKIWDPSRLYSSQNAKGLNCMHRRPENEFAGGHQPCIHLQRIGTDSCLVFEKPPELARINQRTSKRGFSYSASLARNWQWQATAARPWGAQERVMWCSTSPWRNSREHWNDCLQYEHSIPATAWISSDELCCLTDKLRKFALYFAGPRALAIRSPNLYQVHFQFVVVHCLHSNLTSNENRMQK